MDLLSIDEYEKRFSGFGIRDCAVETRGIFYFVKLQDWDNSKPRPFEEELETRLTRLELQGEPQWRTVKLDGFSGLMACGQLLPEATCICVDRGGQVCNKGAGPV
ncbi:hypothetical protein [Ralstonia solanacearum]|uniref:hypothetical protein n=1 Tax=Ralstonia solanacearum TaxID=305 RepID=UPI0018B05D03|nr:hypothetical protein [Ralstonia solanacearum]